MRAFCFAAAVAAFAMPAASAVSANVSAVMFRGGAAHLGVYDSAAPSLHSVKWRFHVNAKLISSPAVAAGMIFFGAGDGNVYALRSSDGSLVWKAATSGPVTSSPAVWNGKVFAGSLDGDLYAFDERTGHVAWRFKTAGERRFTAPGIHGIIPRTEMMPDPFDLFISSPAVAAGTVYFGSGDHNIYAVDAQRGSLKWKFTTGDVVHASPAVINGVVYEGSWDRYLYALDATTGAVRWKFLTGDDPDIHNQIGIVSSAAVSDGIVYFGCRDSHLYALDAKTGSLRWKHDEHGSWVIGSPALSGGTVYYTTSDEKKFFALDAESGKERFVVPYRAFSFSSPSIARGVAYFGTFDGILYAVDTRSGKIVARFLTDGARRNLASYQKKDGSLDLGSIYPDNTLDGIVVGLNRIQTLGSIVASPVIAGGVLYIASTDGTLYALA